MASSAGARRPSRGSGAARESGAARGEPVRRSRVPRPPFRCLRGYAIDPSLVTTLDTVGVGEVSFRVPWESLRPGPVGEYLEVVDIDPPSGCAYEPVDLDTAELLAQDGLAPSEGTPQFHQQMVYAVASLTIANFERALGRRALWRHGPGKTAWDDSNYTQRLRVYPHALREANAYYSPNKVAMLFGYFGASADNPGDHMPNARVFTCLSHDIVAHETTHALLDGMHRQFMSASNPDVLAFHEAFADIVALFQHFTFPEILRHQIALTRGELREQRSLLGALASQFGQATGKRGALRDAIGKMENGKWVPHEPRPDEYQEAKEPHTRGAFLVAAVFDAFISIYERRVADLLRLATGGTGVLRPGAIHPDLVNRLAAEAEKAAQHVLTMCIRALDYCPPTDITFGEYLRALITADYDLVPDDDLNYRVAFVEAFRRRGIYPRDLRTLSIESLLWRGPASEARPLSDEFGVLLRNLSDLPSRFMLSRTREEVFRLQWETRAKLHGLLTAHFASGPRAREDAAFLGIDPDLKSLEVRTARIALRPSPDGSIQPQVLIGLMQRAQVPIDETGQASRETMLFEGGCTIVADLRTLEIDYCIRKSAASRGRVTRQRAFALEQMDSLRATYMGVRPLSGETSAAFEPFAGLHRGCP